MDFCPWLTFKIYLNQYLLKCSQKLLYEKTILSIDISKIQILAERKQKLLTVNLVLNVTKKFKLCHFCYKLTFIIYINQY